MINRYQIIGIITYDISFVIIKQNFVEWLAISQKNEDHDFWNMTVGKTNHNPLF